MAYTESHRDRNLDLAQNLMGWRRTGVGRGSAPMEMRRPTTLPCTAGQGLRNPPPWDKDVDKDEDRDEKQSRNSRSRQTTGTPTLTNAKKQSKDRNTNSNQR